MNYGVAMFLLMTLTADAHAGTITCVGEAISSRAIGGNQAKTSAFADSAILGRGRRLDCFFSSDSSIGRQIDRVCPIRDENASDEPGPSCRVHVEIVRKGQPGFNVIERVIRVERIK